MQLLTERYNKKIQGVIACYDRLIENGFVFIEDYTAAQKLANGFRVETIHRLLDSYAKLYCPVYAQFNLSYHWSIMQAEYATDIVFKKQSDLEAIYDNLVRTIIHTAGIKRLKKASQSVEAKGHSYKGFNFFNEEDLEILQTIARGEFNINGFQNKNLRKHLVQKTSGQVSRILKRLHLHGLIKKVRDTYKYYHTRLGRRVIATGIKLKELYIIPQLCY